MYVIPLPKDGDAVFTPFQGYSLNALGAAELIQRVCLLPATIKELFQTREQTIKQRAAGLGGYAILLLDSQFLTEVRSWFPITCFISTAQTRASVETHIAAHGSRGWLHLTTDRTSSLPHLQTFSRSDMYRWSRRQAKQAIADQPKSKRLRRKIRWIPLVEWPTVELSLARRSHNLTAPTEMALQSLGFHLPLSPKPLACATDTDCVRAISEASHILEQVRHKATGNFSIPGLVSLIVAVPAVYRHLSPAMVRRDTSRPAKRAIRHVLRQQQYIAMRAPKAEGSEILNDREALALFHGRAEELRAYTAALSVSAASLCAPVLRCPPQVDRARDLLIRLAGLSRGPAPDNRRRNQLARSIGNTFRAAIPEAILEQIEKHCNGGIKMIGDTPLELVPIAELPLTLRATVSRMPTLPGNLLMRHALMRAPLFLRAQDFRRVLVVRSFEPNDPIRNHLTTAALEVIKSCSKPIELQIADVQNKDDVIRAFNEFDGPLAIFDGHGSQERNAQEGTITVGPIKLNPHELYGKTRIPPIMFLSACETYTLEGTESSVASAFLFMGAASVLGTLVPIDAVTAGILVARFLLRFTEFLPLFHQPVPWPEIVSGMLRMSYTTDVLRAMDKQLGLGEDAYRKIHTEANLAINQGRADWFEQMLGSIAATSCSPEAEIRSTWLQTCYFTETLHYVHLGQPEHVFILPS